MLTRNQKKRNAGKEKSCPLNSNQNYSIVPGNHAVEVGEMVTMDHGGTSGGLHDYSQRTDMATSHRIISMDPKMLNPVLWRTLPEQLLLLVFARLPVPDIISLSSLSREWRRDMTTVNSHINQACDEASPMMVTYLSTIPSSRHDVLHTESLVTICDLSIRKPLFSYSLHEGYCSDGQWNDMGASDGGLVCFVSALKPTKANPLCIVVKNLLTQVQRKLPPLQYVYSTLPIMMHIEVDSKTKCYRVVVIGKYIEGRPTIEIYDSSARQWTKTPPPLGCIFGLAYTWEYVNWLKIFRSLSTTQSVYDFAEGQLKRCDEKDLSRGASWTTIWKDSKFVITKNKFNGEFFPKKGYCITKYCLQTNAKDWVQERSYFSPFEEDLLNMLYWSSGTIKAFEGFMMMVPYSLGRFDHFWLLNLSTGEWSRFPYYFMKHQGRASIYRALWNAIP